MAKWKHVPQTFFVETPGSRYAAIVERGCLSRLSEFVPPKAHQVFVVTTADVWELQSKSLDLKHLNREICVLFFPGGEKNKRLAAVESLTEQMIAAGGDRSSVVVAFGGGIVTDVAAFTAAVFMRGIPVVQVPTTLLAQVDAAVGGKTGVNLVGGKNLVGAFHQPLGVLIDPSVLSTLPEREYRAGLWEILKAGIIRSRPLFDRMVGERERILRQDPEALDAIIAESVRIKAEVVSADEKEGDLRRILNFGHTVGHALEAETRYEKFLHGEAVAFGMRAATHLARITGTLAENDTKEILTAIDAYGPIPPVTAIDPEALLGRLESDKKTIGGQVHFVLPTAIGTTVVKSGIPNDLVLSAIQAAQK